MQTLNEVQVQFQDYLIQGDQESILRSIAPDDRFSAEKRLQVYFDAYRIRLLEILKQDFPKTHTLLGDQEFAEAFHLYLRKHPSQHFSVRYFGQHFVEFLASTTPYQEYGIFSEMALFEWSLAHTLDAQDAPCVEVTALSAVPPEKWASLSFVFHPSVISHYYRWDTPQLWQYIENENPPRSPVQQDLPVRWICWRKDLSCRFQSCTLAEDKMVQSILAGNNFAEICESLLYTLSENEIPLTAAQILYKWVNEKMLRPLI